MMATGGPIDRDEGVVGATALREEEPVVTRNTEHFERIPNLQVMES